MILCVGNVKIPSGSCHRDIKKPSFLFIKCSGLLTVTGLLFLYIYHIYYIKFESL